MATPWLRFWPGVRQVTTSDPVMHHSLTRRQFLRLTSAVAAMPVVSRPVVGIADRFASSTCREPARDGKDNHH